MSKRAPGEGSIYRRKDGKWVSAVTLGYSDKGRQRRRAISSTQGEARARLKELRAAVEAGTTIESEKITVGQWLREWLEKEAQPSVRPRTFAGYQMIVTKHLIPGLGNLKLRQLDARHVRDFLEKKSKSKTLSTRSIQLQHATLRRALTIAERYGIVPRNVAKLVTPPQVHTKTFEPLTTEQASAFIAGLNDHELRNLFLTAIVTGMRMSELLGLRWKDVSLEKGTVSVNVSLQRYDSAYHLDPPKTKNSRRIIPVPPVIVEALKDERKKQRENKVRLRPVWQGDAWGLVFSMEDGSPRNGSVVTHRFQAALAAAGLPKVRFHDLRHGAATYLLNSGTDARTVMELLGHSQISTTLGIYAHALEANKRAATNRLGDIAMGPTTDQAKEAN